MAKWNNDRISFTKDCSNNLYYKSGGSIIPVVYLMQFGLIFNLHSPVYLDQEVTSILNGSCDNSVFRVLNFG